MASFDRSQAIRLVEMALDEDLGPGDVTTGCLAGGSEQAEGVIISKQPGVLAGAPVVDLLFERLDPRAELEWHATDGDSLDLERVILIVRATASSLLAGERTLLNFLQRLSGIATLTREYVQRVAGTKARIMDTRKTTPGWRSLEKYAVAVGGGTNHRLGLFDQALFKENHLELARKAREPLEEIFGKARAATGALVEIEVRSLAELRRAIDAGADVIMLDNMSLDEMRTATALVAQCPREPRPALEASGGITLETVRAVAETRVDRISVGALTHSPKTLDLAMYIR